MARVLANLLTAIALVAGSTASASAADIKLSDHDIYRIILEGTIVSGDYDKLRKVIEQCELNAAQRPNYFDRFGPPCPPRGIYLASPGGSLTEAMKIGRLVRMLRLYTGTPFAAPGVDPVSLSNPKNNARCASACFFIFVAGINRAVGTDTLGIHRPYMSDADLKTLSANQAMASASQVRTVVEAYLKEMGTPLKYVDVMFSIPKDQVQWINKAEVEADFSGIIPELSDWMNARCKNETKFEERVGKLIFDKNAHGGEFTSEEGEIFGMLIEKMKVNIACEMKVGDELRKEAWKVYRETAIRP